MTEITRLEKAALFTVGAAAAYKTLLWSLEASVTSSGDAFLWLRIIFAALSFIAFDLVIGAVVFRGWSWSGALALIVAAAVSAAIGLDVARVYTMPALHAAPALTLAAFGIHLMLSRAAMVAPTPATETQSAITQAVQVNVGGQLPRTFAQFAAARAAELPDATPAQLAMELGTGEATIRKLLDRAGVVIEQAHQED